MNPTSKWIERNVLKGYRPFVWIVIVGFLVWLQTLFFEFIYLDDNALILENIAYLKDLSNIPKAFSQDFFNLSYSIDAYYRPLILSAFILDAQIGGDAPFMYHLSNVVIHLINACLVFILFTKLGYKRILSFFIAVLFVVHPVMTQAVAWVAGRNDSLLALFTLSSIIMLLHYFKKNKAYFLILHIILFSLALFTKESAIGIIVIGILVYFLKQKRNVAFPMEHRVGMVIGWVIITIIWVIMRNDALIDPLEVSFSTGFRLIIQNIIPISFLYLGKIVLPFDLSVLETTEDSNILWGILSMITIVIALFLLRIRKYRMLILAFSWFFVFTIPSLLITNYLVLENRIYLPFIGILIIVAEILSARKVILTKSVFIWSGVSVLVVLISITLSYTTKFEDRLVYWQTAVSDSPNLPLAHRNLGAMHFLDGRLSEAEAEFIKALDLNPNEQMAHNNLGLVYMHAGYFKESEIEYKKELELYPNYDPGYYNLGLLYYNHKKYKKAEQMWKKTIELNPNYIQAYVGLVLVLEESGQGEEAQKYRDTLTHLGYSRVK